MSNTINAIAAGMASKVGNPEIIDETFGEYLQAELVTVSQILGKVFQVTEGKADVDFLLNVVASYMIGGHDEDPDTKAPYVLFDTILVDAIENYQEAEAEVIDEDEELNYDAGEQPTPTEAA